MLNKLCTVVHHESYFSYFKIIYLVLAISVSAVILYLHLVDLTLVSNKISASVV